MSERRRIAPAPEAEPARGQLHIKYRPKNLGDVFGQPAVVAGLKKSFHGKPDSWPHAFLFAGPKGTGKTTLARIIADLANVDPHNITEIDAASNSGADAMRERMDALRYAGFGENPNRLLLVDEAHNLSKLAWDVLLKPSEEPPPHVFMVFATTNPDKVPATIVSRCNTYKLQPLSTKTMTALLDYVVKAEGMNTPEQVVDRVVDAAGGSPRRALVLLGQVDGLTDPDDIDDILERFDDDKPELIDLVRAIVSAEKWPDIMAMVKAVGDNAEGVRIVAMRYLASCAQGAKNDRDAMRYVNMMEHFAAPFTTTDGNAPLILAIGRSIREARR